MFDCFSEIMEQFWNDTSWRYQLSRYVNLTHVRLAVTICKFYSTINYVRTEILSLSFVRAELAVNS